MFSSCLFIHIFKDRTNDSTNSISSQIIFKLFHRLLDFYIVSSLFFLSTFYANTTTMKMYIDKIFERATIKGIADYLLFGIGPDKDNRSYEERLEEPFRRFEKAVAKYDKSPTSELLDLSNEVTSEVASVYMEIGMQVGMKLMMDVMKNMNRENKRIEGVERKK